MEQGPAKTNIYYANGPAVSHFNKFIYTDSHLQELSHSHQSSCYKTKHEIFFGDQQSYIPGNKQ